MRKELSFIIGALLAFILFICILCVSASGQNPEIKIQPEELACEKLYPAAVILKKGDTLRGYVKWVNRQANQRRVYFYKDADPQTRMQLIPGVTIRSYTVGSLTYENIQPEKDKSFFCDADVLGLKILDGGITLYQFYRDTIGIKFKFKNDTNYLDVCRKEKDFEKNLYAYKNGKYVCNLQTTRWVLKFREAMSELVSDCPDLAQKVINKEKGYRFVNRDKILLEYNEWVKSKGTNVSHN